MDLLKTIVIFILFSCHLHAQKIEREFRISESEFPQLAVNYLKHYELDLKKIKWFKEIQNNVLSYEAKVKVQKHLYSVEFDSLGKIEDIEKLVSFKKLPVETQKVLSTSLEKKLGKYKIIKTQIQYSEIEEETKRLEHLSPQNSTVRYEIELFYKDDKSKKLFEYLLSDNGEIISFREVLIRSTENLTY